MAEPLDLLVDHLCTPVGELVIICDVHATIRAIDWQEFEDRMFRKLAIHYPARGWSLRRARDPFRHTSTLAAYMDGEITAVDRLEVQTGGTLFQREVWRGLRKIPAGTTTSYGALAERIGRPSAVRAVGLANGANPIGIVVPCHRVIGADGSLTGYGGGLERKRWLLAHEARYARYAA